jgi:hypothetical protein
MASASDLLSKGMSLFGVGTARASSSAKPPGPQGRRPLPFYSFEVWDKDGAVKPGVIPGGAPSKVILRIPPANLEVRQPIRSQIWKGFDHQPVVIEAGLGIAHWTLSGSHGVGPTMLYSNGAESAGFHVRNQLQQLFLGYAKENVRRSGSGEPLLRMVFAIRDGSVTEFVNLQWWIQPESLPTDTRTAARPFEWAWSLAFWALDEIPGMDAKPAPADALAPPSVDQIQSKGKGLLGSLKAEIQSAFVSKDTSLLGRLVTLQQGLHTLVARAQDLRRAAVETVNSVRDMTAGVIRQVDAILREVNRIPGLRGNPTLGRLLMDTRRWGGAINRHINALEQGKKPS